MHLILFAQSSSKNRRADYKYFEPHSRSLSVSGHLTPLHTGGMVDTGMGLERVVAVLGDKWTTAGHNMTPDVRNTD